MKSYSRFISLFLFLCILPLIAFCEKTESILGDIISEEARPAFNQFIELASDGNADEAFIFFTDPHLLGGNDVFSQSTKDCIASSFDVAKELYDTLKLGFCLCGGDWLNQGDTQEMAMEKLLFADKHMKMMFPRYYKMMGNHDTNYLGILSKNDTRRGDLPRRFVDNYYFSETGSAYYSFLGNQTQFLVLDSGLDWTLAMDDYRWEQLQWLAMKLDNTEKNHLVVLIHMFYSEGIITPMSSLLVDLCDAYNHRKEITINGLRYDYSSAVGTIHFILSGHSHEDSVSFEGLEKNLPIIETCNYTINGSKTFELCLIDYEKSRVHLIRVGQGNNRTIELIESQGL